MFRDLPKPKKEVVLNDDGMKVENPEEGILFVVSAPSGAGKTTLCKEILKGVPNLQHSISYTTRPIRPTEKPGADYQFVSQERFHELIDAGEFVEWAVVHSHFYGTSRRDLQALLDQGIDIILDIDSQGAMQIRRCYRNGVFIYVLPPSFRDLEERLTLRRADAPEEISKRLSMAREEIKNYGSYEYLIINDDFDKALERLKSIILAERGKMSRVEAGWIEKSFLKKENV